MIKVQVRRNEKGEVIGVNVPPPILAVEHSEIVEVPDNDPLAWVAARHPICEQAVVELREQLDKAVESFDWLTVALSGINGTLDYLRKLDQRGPGWAQKGMEEKNEP